MNRELKVGFFVVAGLVLVAVSVFLIGNVRRLWDPKISYVAAFNDVAGLKPGAPVRMGGLDIGSVVGVNHGDNLGDSRIYVRMSVSRTEAARVREDSIARVINKGLLGDKMIELTAGSSDRSPLSPGAVIASEEPADMMAAANRVATVTKDAVERIGSLAQSLGDPKLAQDIKGSAADMHDLLDAIAHKDSTMHRLLYERAEADRVDELLAHLTQVSAHLDEMLVGAQDIENHVQKGPGIAHALVYDGDISKNVGGSLAELHADLAAIRQGNGIAHAILFGDDSSSHVMSNMNAMSDDLRAIVAGLRQGKGTIGALLVEPTVYEDIKSVVGNVERNEVLRALVRYSIKADEKQPPRTH